MSYGLGHHQQKLKNMWSPIQPTPTCVVILFSIHFVLKAEKLLKKNGIGHDVIPVPREISSDCGMAVEFPCLESEKVLELLAAAGLRLAGLYMRVGKDSFQPISAGHLAVNAVN